MSKHLNRKELREDKFVNTVLASLDWLKNNARNYLPYGVALVIVIVFVGILGIRRQSAETTVSEAVYRVISLYARNTPENNEQALSLCVQMIKQNSQRKGIELFWFYQGNLLYKLERFEDAKGVFQGFLEKTPDHEYAALVRQSLGYCYEELKQYPDAEKIFLELNENGEAFLTPQILLDLARIQSLQGRNEDARSVYDRIILEFEETEYANIAQAHRAFLN